jgi:CRISPR-associated endoribonuclease Cas6
MRFKITLISDQTKGDIILPINYQYELSAFIYHTIHTGNHEFGNWLHENGFIDGNKKFKLFTFSRLQIPKFKQFKDRLIILSDELYFELSFLPIKITEAFISGAFQNRRFSIGDKDSQVSFTIKAIEATSEPVFTGHMKFKAQSPILVTTKIHENQKYPQYLKPGENFYNEKIKNNLIRKYAAICSYNMKEMDLSHANGFDFKYITVPRKKGVDIKVNTPEKTHIIGYEYDFSISGPPELLKTGYYAGFGEKNSLGFGCCGVLKN